MSFGTGAMSYGTGAVTGTMSILMSVHCVEHAPLGGAAIHTE